MPGAGGNRQLRHLLVCLAKSRRGARGRGRGRRLARIPVIHAHAGARDVVEGNPGAAGLRQAGRVDRVDFARARLLERESAHSAVLQETCLRAGKLLLLLRVVRFWRPLLGTRGHARERTAFPGRACRGHAGERRAFSGRADMRVSDRPCRRPDWS